ncbi:hypothetical protein ACF1BN_06260 [Streptomyces sp. NPDC014861]|uniref:hypothetical protein n=1 Tax=Streptomyces sp. NPDC014861 TaxID=3364923 RepID=UPI0036FFBEF1
MKMTLRVLVPVILLLAVTACAGFEPRGGKPLAPMPDHVPKGPVYDSADEVVAALERAGLPCEVIRRPSTSAATCTTEIDGKTVENQIQALNTTDFTRDEVGDSIDSWRTSGNTIVAAGNWFIRALPNREARYPVRIAEALDAVVLPPPYPLPDIPEKPAYATVGALADAMEKEGFCLGREEVDERTVSCGTRLPKKDPATCSGRSRLQLYGSAGERDDAVRLTIRNGRVASRIVTAGYWTAEFCDTTQARRVTDALGAAFIDHRIQEEPPA